MKKTIIASAVAITVCATAHAGDTMSDSAIFKNVPIPNIVVTGVRNQTDPKHLPYTVSTISRQQIEYRYTPSLLSILNEQVPGYFSTSRGIMGYGVSTGAAGNMTIRGIGGSPTTEMMVLIDGHPQYAGVMGHPLGDAYQSFLAEKVEVLRGPASVLYGSNAMGGVINIVTRKMVQDGVHNNIRASFGSYGTLMSEFNNQVKSGKFSSIASLSYNRTDGHRCNIGFEQMSGYMKLGYQLDKNWNVYTDLNITHFNASNPGSMYSSVNDNDQHITRGIASASIANDYGWTSGAVNLFYNWGHHNINDGYADGTTPKDYLFKSDDHVVGFDIYQSFRFFHGNRTTFGVNYQNIGGKAWNDYTSGTITNLVDTTENEIAGYMDFRQDIGTWLTFDAGTRVDYHSAGTEFIPQIGIVGHLPNQIELKASVSKGFRNPTLKDLFMFKPKNADLKAERIWNYELALSQNLLDSRLHYGVNIYYLNGDNLIQTVAGHNENTGKVSNYGLEITTSYRINDNWNINANYSYIHTKYDIVATPKNKLFIGADFSTGKWLLSTGIEWINHLTTQVAPKTEESYVLVNLRATYKVCKAVNLFITGENLLAQKYEVNYGYPMPRATFMGGFDLNF